MGQRETFGRMIVKNKRPGKPRAAVIGTTLIECTKHVVSMSDGLGCAIKLDPKTVPEIIIHLRKVWTWCWWRAREGNKLP